MRNRSQSLRGQVALITGASRGIGLAVAQALASQGCHLVIIARNGKALKKVGRELARHGVRVIEKTCDVRSPRSVESLLATVKKQFGHLDILINNAGTAHKNNPVAKLSFAEWRNVIDTNLTAVFLVSRAALPLMRRGATIVNNLSISATRVFPGASAYNASKHGALGFTRTLREELRPRGIRVVALMPGATDTEIWKIFWPDAPREKMMSSQTVAQAIIDALLLPANSTIEDVVIMPTGGAL